MDCNLLNSIDGRVVFLTYLKSKLIAESDWQRIVIDRNWAKTFPNVPGVYAIKMEDEIIYVGETGSLKKRMLDMLNSQNHTLRRSIGKKYFADHANYSPASSIKKYDKIIENLITEYINQNLYLACIEVRLGRKELEEFIMGDIPVKIRLNIRLSRS